MNIGQLYEMQKALDERIIKEKGLEGQDLLPNTVLALQVEIGEMANEWRGFKHWSNDREPRIEVEVICPTCKGKGEVPNLAKGYGRERFGFTWEKIAAAYVAKNRINHERQENGY